MDRIIVIEISKLGNVMQALVALGFKEDLAVVRQEGVDEGTSRKTVLVWGYVPRDKESEVRDIDGVVRLLTVGGSMVVI